MIMQNLLDGNIDIKLDSYFDKKIQSNLLRFYKRQHKMCFTEPEWKFLYDKHHEVSNFCGLLNDLQLRPIVGVPKRPVRKRKGQ